MIILHVRLSWAISSVNNR